MKQVLLLFAIIFSFTTVMAQVRISGVVKKSDGKPVEGASVVYKKTGKGVTSDALGKYTIGVEALPAVLEISFTGFQTISITATSEQVLEINMIIADKAMDEVVVVGYATQKKVNLTGAITSIKMDDILGDRPVTNTASALQGAIPNLLITSSSGRPGTTSSLQIRGFESINGGSPLVLVDNVPMSINDINPRDIETVTVLKDASASSIYGGRAAFGVILITTKKGKKNQSINFNYSNNFVISKPSELPQKASILEMVTGLKNFGTLNYWSNGQNIQTWYDMLLDYTKNPSAYPNGEKIITQPSGATTRYGLKENDLIGDLFGNSFEQQHNFSFSGGSEKTSYRVSLGYANEDGIMITKKDSYKRYNLNTNLNTEIAKNLNATVNLMYKNDHRLSPNNYSTLFRNVISWTPDVPTGNYTKPDGTVIPYSTPSNIIKIEPTSDNRGQDLRLFGKLDYTPVKNWHVTAEYTFDKAQRDISQFIAKNDYWAATTLGPQILNATTLYYKYASGQDYHAFNLYTSYEKNLGSHNLKALVGANYELSQFNDFWTQKTDVLGPSAPSISTSTGVTTSDDSFSEFAIAGYFTRLNYSYKNKYLLELNGRYDASSRFPKSRRYGFFPSASAGWLVSEENFMKGGIKNVINSLKIRGSYGEIGNQVVGDNYPYIPGIAPRNAGWVDPVTGIRLITLDPPSLVSSNFTWERVKTANLGTDIELFKGKLNLAFDIYQRQTLDMLTAGSQLPIVLGASAPLQNAADLKTKGWEANVMWKQKFKNGLSFSFGFNLADNQTEITKFKNDAGLLSQYYVGRKIGEIWGFETQGYFTIDDFVSGTLNANLMNGTLKPGIAPYQGVTQHPGDIRYVDRNNDGKIFTGNNTLADPGDMKIIGNSSRRFPYGISASAGYKNFDLSIFGHGIGKRDVWLDNQLFWLYTTEFEAFYKHQLDYWTPANTNAYYPRSYANASGSTGNSRRVQTKYLQSGAYFRLKNIEVGYTIPAKILRKASLTNLRIYFSGENLATFKSLPDGIDPEIANENSGGGYPYIKKLSFGINLTF
jgi:TonB-linked SusC/RagA family outer membrane protein